MPRKGKFSAIILAAGFSSRMAEFKPLIRIGEKSFVEHAIALFRTAGIEDIVTVLGHRAPEVAPVVQRAASRGVINANYADGMYSSIKTGLKAIQPSCDAFFLLPVDIPLVRPSTVRQLAVAFAKHPAPSVCYPLFQSTRGHPPLINGELVGAILSYDGDGGLRAFLRRHEEQSIAIPVDDPFIRLDADTPEDLLRLKEMMRGKSQAVEAGGEVRIENG
ncbi:MAG: nucleotidyltransferase family protein [Desulfobacterales bacterium]|nr:nucleotidyltransferase family protein [Desulfobacterales bacterium]